MVAKFEQVQYDCLMSVEAVEFIEIFEALPVEKKLRSPISPVFYSKSPRIIGGNK